MGTVTVTGRDELGRLIDVTITTIGEASPPGPELATSAIIQAGTGGAVLIKTGPGDDDWSEVVTT